MCCIEFGVAVTAETTTKDEVIGGVLCFVDTSVVGAAGWARWSLIATDHLLIWRRNAMSVEIEIRTPSHARFGSIPVVADKVTVVTAKMTAD